MPVEPTTEMRYAYHEANQRYLEGSIPSPDGQWWAMLDAAPQPEGDGWIKCSERLPTKVDADCFNQVWLTDVSGDGLQMEPWQVDWSFVTKGSGHWKPTGLKRPQPPKEGE